MPEHPKNPSTPEGVEPVAEPTKSTGVGTCWELRGQAPGDAGSGDPVSEGEAGDLQSIEPTRRGTRIRRLPDVEKLRAQYSLDGSVPSGLRFRYKCGSRRPGDPAGRILPRGRWMVGFKGAQYYAHRVVYAIAHGADAWPLEVDHIDGNSSNNASGNLRACSRSENARNVGPNKRTKSAYRGVTQSGPSKRWTALISTNGKHRHLGSYVTEREAASAYNEAALELHGSFARLNVLDEPGRTVSALEWRRSAS